MQLSLRIPDELAASVRQHADGSGRSVNSWITLILTAAVDPELAGTEAEKTRERLGQAGLLAHSTRSARRPDPHAVKRAQAAAAEGTPLESLVSDARG